MKRLFLLLAGISLLSSANAQPFGIEMGTSIRNLSDVQEIASFTYRITPPRQHPEFETYVVRATPKQGVCQINAVGKDHRNDRYGRSVQRAFDGLRSQLDEIYGRSGFVDGLRPRALWNGTHEWVMAIRQNERVYQAAWDEEEGSRMRDNVESILMQVNATSASSSWINLQYRFNNHGACRTEMDASHRDAL